MFKFIQTPVAPSRLAALVLVFVVILYSPILGLGFLSDDYLWLNTFTAPEKFATKVAPYFVTIDDPVAREFWNQQGSYFWWMLDDFRWTLLRPLSNAILYLEFQTFSTNSTGYLVTSLALYVTLLALTWRLYSSLLPARIAVFALALFAMHFGHVQSVWMICNQHALVAAVVSTAALFFYLRHREGGSSWPLVLAIMLAMVGFASSESALECWGYLVTYELFAREESVRSKIHRLIVPTLLVFSYLLAHHLLGYQIKNNGLYLDPFDHTLRFLEAQLERFPVLLASTFNVLPADFWMLRPSLRPYLIFSGVLVTIQVLTLVHLSWSHLPVQHRRALRWMFPGALLALFPATSAPPGGRLVLVATLGGCLVMAIIFDVAWRVLRQEPSKAARRAWRLCAMPMMFMNLVFLPLFVPIQLQQIGVVHHRRLIEVKSSEIDSRQIEHQHLIALTVPSQSQAMEIMSGRIFFGLHAAPRGWWVLACAPVEVRITRTGLNRLQYEFVDGHLLEEGMLRLYRPEWIPLREGQLLARGPFSAKIVQADAVGVKKVEFIFSEVLEHQSYQFLSWQDDRLRPVKLPEVGQSLTIPWSEQWVGRGL